MATGGLRRLGLGTKELLINEATGCVCVTLV